MLATMHVNSHATELERPKSVNPVSGNELAQHWFLVVVCAVGIAIGVAVLPFYTQGVFIEAWVKEFGWTRAQASLGVLTSSLTLAAISPFTGHIVDRFGLVRPLLISFIGLSFSYALLGLFLSSLTTFIVLIMIQAVLGAGTSPLAYTRAINIAFSRQRGLALGLALSGTGMTAIFGPAIVGMLIADYGWRWAYFAISGFVLILGAIIVTAMSRLEIKADQAVGATVLVEPEVKTATQSRAYWTLLFAMFCLALALGGLIVHFVPILIEAGMTMPSALATVGVIGIAVILGRLIVGFAVDRIFAPYVIATVIFACTCGVIALVLGGAPTAAVAAFVIGFALGAEVDLISYFVARYFSLATYGRIYGQQYAVFMVGVGLSPAMLGAIRDVSGAYTSSLIAASILMVFAFALFLTLPPFPQRLSDD